MGTPDDEIRKHLPPEIHWPETSDMEGVAASGFDFPIGTEHKRYDPEPPFYGRNWFQGMQPERPSDMQEITGFYPDILATQDEFGAGMIRMPRATRAERLYQQGREDEAFESDD